ncbi:MAG: LysM peptidoglycan-binding domain-containing protein [Chloroflexi bacterium]|nr:LysM peptidoglycan-binding domain-containing protein [Chloroflexota bacterium]
MNDDSALWQRSGGYLVLLVVAILLFFGWRIGLAGGLQDEAEGAATAVSTPSISQSVETAVRQDQASLYDFSTGDLPVLNETGLAPQSNPHTYQGELPSHTFETYLVKRGDTPGQIAAQFGIAVETLLGGNARLSQEATLLQTPATNSSSCPLTAFCMKCSPAKPWKVCQKNTIFRRRYYRLRKQQPGLPYRLYPETNIMVPGAVREVVIWQPPAVASSGGSGLGGGIKPLIVGLAPSNIRWAIATSRSFTGMDIRPSTLLWARAAPFMPLILAR